MTAPTSAPTPAAAAAAPAAPAKSGGLAQLEANLGGPKRAVAIGLAVVVAGLAVYEKRKKSSSKSSSTSSSDTTDAGATTDMDSLPDWDVTLYEQQQQSSNPVPVPTSTGTSTPTAPTPTNPVKSGGSPPKSSTPPKKATGSTSKLTQSYTVVKGDTLWGIAKKYLGNGEDWNEIYDANKSVIGDNPNLIKPGEKLKV